MFAARRTKKPHTRPAYANAVGGKVLYFPFLCVYNGYIRTSSGSVYNRVEAYIPFLSTVHPPHISTRETGIYLHRRITSSGLKVSIASPYTFPAHSGRLSFVKKHSRKRLDSVYRNNDITTTGKNKKQASTARHSGKQPPHSGSEPVSP